MSFRVFGFEQEEMNGKAFEVLNDTHGIGMVLIAIVENEGIKKVR